MLWVRLDIVVVAIEEDVEAMEEVDIETEEDGIEAVAEGLIPLVVIVVVGEDEELMLDPALVVALELELAIIVLVVGTNEDEDAEAEEEDEE